MKNITKLNIIYGAFLPRKLMYQLPTTKYISYAA